MICGGHIQNIQSYLCQHSFDCLIIYNGIKEEPSFIKPMLQDEPIDAMVAFITPSSFSFYVPGRYADLASKKHNMQILPSPTKVHMLEDIYKYLHQDFKRIGLCGRISYQEYNIIQSICPIAKIESLDTRILKIYANKTFDTKKSIQKIQSLTQHIFDSIKVRPGMTEKDIEKQFLDHIPSGYTKAFLSIAGFDNLRDSTIASATDRVINTGEVVCIDFGLYGNGVHSDMTRCFFVGDDRFGLRDGYHRIQLVINESLQFIIPGKHNKEFIQDLIDVSKKYGLTEYCLTDLGHGIGWDLHEYPDLYNDDFIFEEGMCFTLEPEYKLNGYFLRYEDIYTIHQGETLLLQSLA